MTRPSVAMEGLDARAVASPRDGRGRWAMDELTASSGTSRSEALDMTAVLDARRTVDAATEARWAAGDDDAFRDVYELCGSLVYSFCKRTLGPENAADATQEVFLAAWRSRDRYRPESGSLAGWLTGIAR